MRTRDEIVKISSIISSSRLNDLKVLSRFEKRERGLASGLLSALEIKEPLFGAISSHWNPDSIQEEMSEKVTSRSSRRRMCHNLSNPILLHLVINLQYSTLCSDLSPSSSIIHRHCSFNSKRCLFLNEEVVSRPLTPGIETELKGLEEQRE